MSSRENGCVLSSDTSPSVRKRTRETVEEGEQHLGGQSQSSERACKHKIQKEREEVDVVGEEERHQISVKEDSAHIRDIIDTIAFETKYDKQNSLESTISFSKSLKSAVSALASAAKCEENISTIVEGRGIEVSLALLRACVRASGTHFGNRNSGKVTPENLIKNICVVIGLVAVPLKFRRQIINEGGIAALVKVLRSYSPLCVQSMLEAPPVYVLARRAASALTNLSHEDMQAKHEVRREGGIPPLVLLLRAKEFSVQIAAAGALKAIAFRNEDNKNQIVECGALPALVGMLRAKDSSIHYEAVAVLSNLVHSSAHIKKLVLNGGALQPLISLLTSTCTESRREAALLLGQFANVQEPDYKTKIVQRGALGPLIAMLSESNIQACEMAAFAIGRLAQNPDNQAGIVQADGLKPLLALLNSQNLNSQHNAAFALYGLSDNDDNVHHFLKSGAVLQLLNGDFHMQASKDCVKNTLKKLEEKTAQVHVMDYLKHLLSSTSSTFTTKHYIATGLTYLAPKHALYNIFIEHSGLEVLFHSALHDKCATCQKESVDALHRLGETSFSNLPTIENGVRSGFVEESVLKPRLGEMYLNNPKLADVIFEVENQKLYAHKLALLAASNEFSEMLQDDATSNHVKASEKFGVDIEYATLMKVMKYIYTGQVQITDEDNAQSLLCLAETFKLDGLKFACETFLLVSIDAHTVSSVYNLAIKANATYLKKCAVWYLICEYSRLVLVHGLTKYTKMLANMLPTFGSCLQGCLQGGA